MSKCSNCGAEMEKAEQDLELYFPSQEVHGEIFAEHCPECGKFEITGWRYV